MASGCTTHTRRADAGTHSGITLSPSLPFTAMSGHDGQHPRERSDHVSARRRVRASTRRNVLLVGGDRKPPGQRDRPVCLARGMHTLDNSVCL